MSSFISSKLIGLMNSLYVIKNKSYGDNILQTVIDPVEYFLHFLKIRNNSFMHI